MSHRSHLTAVQIASAFRESCLRERYSLRRGYADLMAGTTVGIIAIPLAMALAIASGVAPQHGLYTAIIAGFAVALTGGSRYSVTGPTAAFVVILHPVAQQFGLGGLLVATLLAGCILIGMAVARLGRLIEYIPEQVTLGFTAGIAVVIATLQVKDFFGLRPLAGHETYAQQVAALWHAAPTANSATVLVGVVTLLLLVVWPKLKLPVPGHLPAVVVGALLAWALAKTGHPVETIGSRFDYLLPDGSSGHGIPPVLPHFLWPWTAPGPDGGAIVWSWSTLRTLLPAAFSIAMLGAIESLLCAVVLDGMSGRRHQANGELLGQGIGNLLAPFFGGITATAAIARSAANFRGGAQSPVASMVHALVVLIALLALAPIFSYLPMASLAALLLIVAWNMSEAHRVIGLIRQAPRGDVLVLLTCAALTVLFDMVIAISTGIVLASLLFMRNIAKMTKITDVTQQRKHVPMALQPGWAVYKIDGPLFFAAADRVFSQLALLAARMPES